MVDFLSFIALNANLVTVKSDISILDDCKYETPQGRSMKMPSLITKMLALPKTKKFKYLIYLHY